MQPPIWSEEKPRVSTHLRGLQWIVLKRLSLGSSGLDTYPSSERILPALDAAAVGSLAEVARDLVQQMQTVNRESANPSDELTDALTNFRQYVKYLAKIAKQSDLMAAEIKAVESAAECNKGYARHGRRT